MKLDGSMQKTNHGCIRSRIETVDETIGVPGDILAIAGVEASVSARRLPARRPEGFGENPDRRADD
jgi:hypothetical protein